MCRSVLTNPGDPVPVPTKSSPVTGKRVLLRDVVRDQLRDAILDGTFQAGEVLHDAELMEWLGVSRTPLREAINDLARMGLIEMEPNRYTRVVNPKPSEMVMAFHTLGVLHGGAVALGLLRLSPERRREVDDLATLWMAAVRKRDMSGIRDSFNAIFAICAEGSGNAIYRTLLGEETYGLRYLTIMGVLARLIDDRGWTELESAAGQLLRALAADDAEAARVAVERAHLGWITPDEHDAR
nr:GntR family transcriptional regulator [Leifsonia aquatica]